MGIFFPKFTKFIASKFIKYNPYGILYAGGYSAEGDYMENLTDDIIYFYGTTCSEDLNALSAILPASDIECIHIYRKELGDVTCVKINLHTRTDGFSGKRLLFDKISFASLKKIIINDILSGVLLPDSSSDESSDELFD